MGGVEASGALLSQLLDLLDLARYFVGKGVFQGLQFDTISNGRNIPGVASRTLALGAEE